MKLFALFALTSSLFLSLTLAEAPEKSGTFRRKQSERIQGEPLRGVRKPTPPPQDGKKAEALRKASIFNDETIAKFNQEKQNGGRARTKSIADIIQDLKNDPELKKVTERFASQSSLQGGGAAKPPSMEHVKEFLDSPGAKGFVDRVQSSVQDMLGGFNSEELKKLREQSQAMFSGLKMGEKKEVVQGQKAAAAPDMDALMKSPEIHKAVKSILKDDKAIESFRKLTEEFLTPKLNPTTDQNEDQKSDNKKNARSGLDKLLKDINLNLDDLDVENLLNASKRAPKSPGKRHARRQSSFDDDFTDYDDDSWYGARRHMDSFL